MIFLLSYFVILENAVCITRSQSTAFKYRTREGNIAQKIVGEVGLKLGREIRVKSGELDEVEEWKVNCGLPRA